MSKTIAAVISAIAASFFALFLFWPIAQTLRGAFVDARGGWTAAYILEISRNPVYLEGFRNAFAIAIFSTLMSVLLALPLALIADRYNFPGKNLLTGLLLAPLVLPPFVGALGLKQILGQAGALNALLIRLQLLDAAHPIDWLARERFWGVVFLNALHLFPIIYLNAAAALANIDPSLEEAAENLGAHSWHRFRRITLPLMMPGLFAGGTIVFIWAFTELGVPLMFDYTRVTSVQIFSGLKEIGSNPFPYALVAVTLLFALLLYATSKLLFGRTSYAMMAKATSAPRAKKLSRPAEFSCSSAFIFVIGLSLLPHLGVVLLSVAGDWYQTILPSTWTASHFQAALSHNLTVPSIQNSLKYASLAAILDLFLGVAIAWVVVRTQSPARHVLDACAMLPLAVPGLVLAFGYVAMSQEGRAFSFLNPARDPTALLVIAYGMRRLPYVVRSAAAGFEQISPALEEAAVNLGATPLRALRRVTLPLISANIFVGGLLAFSFAMLEVSDSLILAQKQVDFPITRAIFELFNLLGEGRFLACALGVWAMIFLGASLLAINRILGRKLGTLFRVS